MEKSTQGSISWDETIGGFSIAQIIVVAAPTLQCNNIRLWNSCLDDHLFVLDQYYVELFRQKRLGSW